MTDPTDPEVLDAQGVDLASGIAAFEAKEFRRALQLLSPLAEAGVAEAQYRVAVMYQNGLGLVARPELAHRAMLSAAEQGLGPAQHGLAYMYLHGECAAKDPREAARWLEAAAAQGMAGSMIALAELYRSGDGVERDPDRARALYAEAGFDPQEFDIAD